MGENCAAKKYLQTADIYKFCLKTYKFCLNVIFLFQKGNIQFWGIFRVETLFQKLWPLLYKRAELGFRLTNVLFSNAQYLDPYCTNNCTCNAYKCLRIKSTTLLFLELFFGEGLKTEHLKLNLLNFRRFRFGTIAMPDHYNNVVIKRVESIFLGM